MASNDGRSDWLIFGKGLFVYFLSFVLGKFKVARNTKTKT